jgi:hypothetical protein
MDELPNKTHEDNLVTHDYLSIAVEFDNGQDITYYWSSELSVDTGFHYPIPTWSACETHVVARSGVDGFGQSSDEERDVYRGLCREDRQTASRQNRPRLADRRKPVPA